jgi:hypothetical protein
VLSTSLLLVGVVVGQQQVAVVVLEVFVLERVYPLLLALLTLLLLVVVVQAVQAVLQMSAQQQMG